MRALWIVLKVIVGIVFLVPLSIIVLATALGVLGALVGLAVLVLKLALVGVVVVGLYKVGKRLFGGAPKPAKAPAPLPPADPYYHAAMRELDRELSGSPMPR